MRNVSVFILLAVATLFAYCSASRKVQAPPKITFEANVHPIITSSCSPCHVGATAKQKVLTGYPVVKEEIDDIITRIQKNPGEKGFMPFKHPKLPDSTIQVFVQWKNDGLLEK